MDAIRFGACSLVKLVFAKSTSPLPIIVLDYPAGLRVCECVGVLHMLSEYLLHEYNLTTKPQFPEQKSLK